jgi:hypothetical protein
MQTPRICSIADFGDIWFSKRKSANIYLLLRGHISESQSRVIMGRTGLAQSWSTGYVLTRYYARAFNANKARTDPNPGIIQVIINSIVELLRAYKMANKKSMIEPLRLRIIV